MRYSPACLCVFLLYFVTSNYQCLKIIPERAEIVYINTSYLEDNAVMNVRRYIRKGDYYLNMFFQTKVDMTNAGMFHAIFYEYLHNEFRRAFPEMHFSICHLINQDPYFGKTLRDVGLTRCSFPPGKYALRNMSFHQVNFPSVWPFEKGMCEFSVRYPDNSLVAKTRLVMTFKQDIPKRRT